MRNLCYFCHYHKGDAREKSIKIGGGVLLATALFLISGSIQVGSAAEQSGGILSQLLPESGYLIAQDSGQSTAAGSSEANPEVKTVSAPEVQPAPAQPGPTCRVDGVERPGSCENYPPKDGSGMTQESQPGPGDDPQDDEEHERFEAQRAKEDQARVRRDILQQKRDLGRLLKQLQRLKGAQDDMASANTLLAAVVEHETAISSAQETEDIREALQAYFDAEIWEEIQKIRRKVELPKELNMLLKELTRAQRILGQKSFQKLGVDVASIKGRVVELLAKHSEAKAAYGQGDFESAEEALQDFRENHPGNLTGAMNMLKGIRDQLRGVRDKDFTADMEDLLTSPIEDLNSGEWQSARESLEAIQRELGPVVWRKIMQNQKYRKGIPEDVFEKIGKLKDKLGEVEPAPVEPSPAGPVN